MTNGIPPGSVLDPLLFITYINGLPQQLPMSTNRIMFADGTTLLDGRGAGTSNSKLYQSYRDHIELPFTIY